MVGPDGPQGLFHNDSMILCRTGSAQSPWWPCPDLSGKVVPAESTSWAQPGAGGGGEAPGQGSHPRRTQIPGEGDPPAVICAAAAGSQGCA